MILFYLTSLGGTIFCVVDAYKPTHKRLLEFQQIASPDGQSVAESSHDDRISLQQVVVSPSQSRSGTLYQMRGALHDEPASHPTSMNLSPAPVAVKDAIMKDSNVQAGTERLGSQTFDLDSAPNLTEQPNQHQDFPMRQDSGSSTGTTILNTALFPTKVNRRASTN